MALIVSPSSCDIKVETLHESQALLPPVVPTVEIDGSYYGFHKVRQPLLMYGEDLASVTLGPTFEKAFMQTVSMCHVSLVLVRGHYLFESPFYVICCTG